jgi:antitoxin component of RelBE/YafQ-DinJ toxin-antitoxin module
MQMTGLSEEFVKTRLPRSLKRRAEALARRKMVSVSDVIRFALVEYCAANAPKKQPEVAA